MMSEGLRRCPELVYCLFAFFWPHFLSWHSILVPVGFFCLSSLAF